MIGAIDLAKRFHEAYERLAGNHGYQTRKDSAVPWDEVPTKNKTLMIATCDELVGWLTRETNTLRESVKRLNRRCQQAESVARQNVAACKRAGQSMGRGLANWAARDIQRWEREHVLDIIDMLDHEVGCPTVDDGNIQACECRWAYLLGEEPWTVPPKQRYVINVVSTLPPEAVEKVRRYMDEVREGKHNVPIVAVPLVSSDD